MVATLAKLRLRMMANSLKRETWRIVLMLIAILYGLAMLGLGVAGLLALGFMAEPATRDLVMVLVGSALVIGWIVVPVIGFGIDDTLDPQRFALWLTPSPRFAVGLVLAGAVSVPGIVTVIVCLATSLAWIGSGSVTDRIIGAVIGLLTGIVGAVMCFLLARLATTVSASGMRGRRSRDLLGIVGFVAVMALAFLPLTLQSISISLDSFVTLGRILAWTPFGALWVLPADLIGGDLLAGGARLAIVAATLALAGLAYVKALGHSMTTVSSATGPSARRATRLPFAHTLLARFDGRRLFGLRITPATAAVAGRSLRYWRGDPRYQVSAGSMLLLPLLPLLMGFVAAVQGGGDLRTNLGVAVLFMAPFMAWMGGWGMHADIAYDNTAFWMHVSTGIRGAEDLLGRVIGYAVWQLPLVLVLAIVPAAVLGQQAYIPAVLGGSLALLGAGYGVSAVTTLMLPYPVPPPGANPLSTKGGGATASLVAQMLSFLVLGALMIPTLLTLIPVLAVSTAWGWLTLVVGIASGAGWLALGLRMVDRRYPAQSVTVLNRIKSWPTS